LSDGGGADIRKKKTHRAKKTKATHGIGFILRGGERWEQKGEKRRTKISPLESLTEKDAGRGGGGREKISFAQTISLFVQTS